MYFTVGYQNTTTTGPLITRSIIVNQCQEEITDIKIIHLPTNTNYTN